METIRFPEWHEEPEKPTQLEIEQAMFRNVRFELAALLGMPDDHVLPFVPYADREGNRPEIIDAGL